MHKFRLECLRAAPLSPGTKIELENLRVAMMGSLPPEHNGSGVGGIAVHTACLATALAASGVDVSVFAADYAGPDGALTSGGFRAYSYRHPRRLRRALAALTGALRLHALRSRPRGFRAFIRTAVLAETYAAVLDRREFDLIHSHVLRLAGLAAATRQRGIPLVATVHSLRGHTSDALLFAERVPGLANADALIAVSDALRTEAIQYGLSEERSHVIPNGVDTSRFFPIPVAEARRRCCVPADAFVVLQVAHLIPRKGLDVSIRAVATAFAAEPRAHLYAVGDQRSPMDDEWVTQTRELPEELGVADRVHFVGGISSHHDSQLNDWYNAADVVLLPSRAEGMGLVILEAMACAKPVIGTRVGGIPNVIAEGRTGLLVAKEDVPALATALRDLFENPSLAAKLGAAGLSEARELYSWSGVADRVRTVYENVLAASSTTHG